jgi:hypothetical protein
LGSRTTRGNFRTGCAFEAEKSVKLVAEDFEIDKEAVGQAIAFEEQLRAGAGLEDQT